MPVREGPDQGERAKVEDLHNIDSESGWPFVRDSIRKVFGLVHGWATVYGFTAPSQLQVRRRLVVLSTEEPPWPDSMFPLVREFTVFTPDVQFQCDGNRIPLSVARQLLRKGTAVEASAENMLFRSTVQAMDLSSVLPSGRRGLLDTSLHHPNLVLGGLALNGTREEFNTVSDAHLTEALTACLRAMQLEVKDRARMSRMPPEEAVQLLWHMQAPGSLSVQAITIKNIGAQVVNGEVLYLPAVKVLVNTPVFRFGLSSSGSEDLSLSWSYDSSDGHPEFPLPSSIAPKLLAGVLKMAQTLSETIAVNTSISPENLPRLSGEEDLRNVAVLPQRQKA